MVIGPIIHVLEDPSCYQPANACADTTGLGQCEILNAPRSGLGCFSDTTYAVVSERVHSNKALTVRFEQAGP